MRGVKFIVPAILLVGVVVFQSLFIVQEISQAIVLQFGDPKKIVTKADKLIDAKNIHFQTTKYNQVFSNKYGYLNNLSIIDLLFNLGPNTIDYLKSTNIKL